MTDRTETTDMLFVLWHPAHGVDLDTVSADEGFTWTDRGRSSREDREASDWTCRAFRMEFITNG